jgi:hypothetical protein
VSQGIPPTVLIHMFAILIALFAFLAPSQELWQFDNLQSIGGHKPTVEGHPQVVDGAIRFNGIDDALFFPVHPLAGAETFTWEVVFRPDPTGKPEQRFFHFQVDGSDDRMLFEIRIIDGQWCLDTFVKSGDASATLLDRTKLHPLGPWYRAEAVYDGKTLSNYVDGVLQGQAELHAAPQKPGQTSVGVRFNRKDYFKGSVKTARMTPRALPVSAFL